MQCNVHVCMCVCDVCYVDVNVILCYAILFLAMLCYAILLLAMLCYVMYGVCYVM